MPASVSASVALQQAGEIARLKAENKKLRDALNALAVWDFKASAYAPTTTAEAIAAVSAYARRALAP